MMMWKYGKWTKEHFPFAIYAMDRFQGHKYMHSDDSWICDVPDKGWLIPNFRYPVTE